MIKDKFKDRFEELSTSRAYNIDDNYDIVMNKEDWLNALSEIDKEVEKEREGLVKLNIELEKGLRRYKIKNIQSGFHELAFKDKITDLEKENTLLITALTEALQTLKTVSVAAYGHLTGFDQQYEKLQRYESLISKYSNG